MHFAQPAASLIIAIAAFVLAQATPVPSQPPTSGPPNASFAWPSPAPSLSPTPTGPVYAGDPATRFTVEQRPLGFDADGERARGNRVGHLSAYCG